MRAHRSQWISHKINIRHPEQLKKLKSWATSLTELPIQPIYLKIGPNWPNWQCYLAGSSKRAPRIFIFSIVLGAEYLSYVKSIETHSRTFLLLNISAISSVTNAYGRFLVTSKRKDVKSQPIRHIQWVDNRHRQKETPTFRIKGN